MGKRRMKNIEKLADLLKQSMNAANVMDVYDYDFIMEIHGITLAAACFGITVHPITNKDTGHYIGFYIIEGKNKTLYELGE